MGAIIILKTVEDKRTAFALIKFPADGSFRLLLPIIFKLRCSKFFIRLFQVSDKPRRSDPQYVKGSKNRQDRCFIDCVSTVLVDRGTD